MTKEFERFYHYTSVAGCFGILNSRSVWLTDYRFLNDKLELRQGLNSFLAQIPSAHRQSFERAFRSHDFGSLHCVFSLSRSPTILSQWRAYASDGTGMALGLNTELLRWAGLSLVECRYEDHDSYASELVSRHEQFVASVHEASERHRAENCFMNWVASNKSGFDAIVEDLIALKNPAFAEENEIRATWSRKMGDDTVKMRLTQDLLVPYVEAKIWPDDEKKADLSVVIPEIWLGPKCNELNFHSLVAMNIGMCAIRRHDCGYV